MRYVRRRAKCDRAASFNRHRFCEPELLQDLAKIGHEVVADDDDQAKIDLMRSGKAWFYEPELEPLGTRSNA